MTTESPRVAVVPGDGAVVRRGATVVVLGGPVDDELVGEVESLLLVDRRDERIRGLAAMFLRRGVTAGAVVDLFAGGADAFAVGALDVVAEGRRHGAAAAAMGLSGRYVDGALQAVVSEGADLDVPAAWVRLDDGAVVGAGIVIGEAAPDSSAPSGSTGAEIAESDDTSVDDDAPMPAESGMEEPAIEQPAMDESAIEEPAVDEPPMDDAAMGGIAADPLDAPPPPPPPAVVGDLVDAPPPPPPPAVVGEFVDAPPPPPPGEWDAPPPVAELAADVPPPPIGGSIESEAVEPDNGGHAYERPVRVLGTLSPAGFFNHPEAARCRESGTEMIVGATRVLVEGDRPSLGELTFDDGAVHTVRWNTVIGRDPALDERVMSGSAAPLIVADDDLKVSRRHVLIELVDWDVMLTDLETANGTYVRERPEDSPRRLDSGERVRLRSGAEVFMGDRSFTFTDHNLG